MNNTAPTANCPFCISNNLLKGEVLARSGGAYLAQTKSSPDNYLIIPIGHVESPLVLSDTWWHEVKELLIQTPHVADNYNISLNIGAHAGQSIKHLHFWIIPRMAGKPTSGKGLARLIKEVDASNISP
ncbi:MAG TPA: HIT domain-containing protein [Candidatus Limnocylindrales bacterium]|nr:HIT domain-containing protein [Candidatus Limnocylindrales bacterium]